jgi:ADP-heptose:LPS heptosyltransferase
MDILVVRTAANGDVLVASAVLGAIKKKHPGCTLFFSTGCPATIMHHPHIDHLVSPEAKDEDFTKVYDMDLAYENRPYANILDSYCEVAGISRAECEFHITKEIVNKPLFNNYVVIHAGRTNWVGRDWETKKFEELALKFHNAGMQIICVGTKKDRFVPCDADARGKTTPRQLATLIQDAKLFIGIDSLPMHVAQFVGTPGLAFFGSVDPSTRIYRDNMIAVKADIPCSGCHHRKPAPCCVTDECETGNLECEAFVSVDDMWNKAEAIL